MFAKYDADDLSVTVQVKGKLRALLPDLAWDEFEDDAAREVFRIASFIRDRRYQESDE